MDIKDLNDASEMKALRFKGMIFFLELLANVLINTVPTEHRNMYIV